MEETGVPGEKTTDLTQVTDKLYHIMLYTSPWVGFELTTSVVIGTEWIYSCKSNYHMLIALFKIERCCVNDVQYIHDRWKIHKIICFKRESAIHNSFGIKPFFQFICSFCFEYITADLLSRQYQWRIQMGAEGTFAPPPLKIKKNRKRERWGIFRPSIKHISIHSI